MTIFRHSSKLQHNRAFMQHSSQSTPKHFTGHTSQDCSPLASRERARQAPFAKQTTPTAFLRTKIFSFPPTKHTHTHTPWIINKVGGSAGTWAVLQMSAAWPASGQGAPGLGAGAAPCGLETLPGPDTSAWLRQDPGLEGFFGRSPGPA